MALGGEDSCRWANDNECDEPGIGTDNCTSGTDLTDCAAVAYLRNRTTPVILLLMVSATKLPEGDGTCEAFSDTADCLGRSRPAGLENHFFGRDDRFWLMRHRHLGVLPDRWNCKTARAQERWLAQHLC